MKCVGTASPWGGSSYFATPARTSSSNNLTTLNLGNTLLEETDLGRTNTPLTSVFADYTMVCSLPNGKEIMRYYVREK